MQSDLLSRLWAATGVAHLEIGQILMIAIGGVLIYLAIAKKFEPLLLVPIGFGAILSNIPVAEISGPEGLLGYLYAGGVSTGIFPLLIFMGVGAHTDFGALIANPPTLLLGAAAQFGIFFTLIGSLAMNVIPGLDFSLTDAAAIGIIGGADGPTAIFLASRLSPSLLGAIAVAAYSYMALVPDHPAPHNESADDGIRASCRHETTPARHADRTDHVPFYSPPVGGRLVACSLAFDRNVGVWKPSQGMRCR